MKADKFPACLGHVLNLHFAWGRYTSSNGWKNYSNNLRREMENFGEKKKATGNKICLKCNPHLRSSQLKQNICEF